METNQHLLYLLKHGSAAQVEHYLHYLQKEQKNSDEPADFAAFMDGVIKKSRYSRKQIAQRAGLSQDYTYKLLNGQKRTRVRDYLLAIFFALSMDSNQSQKGLRIYPIEPLDTKVFRDYVIMMALDARTGLDKACEMLEKAGLKPIVTSVSEQPELGPGGSNLPTPAMLLSESAQGNRSPEREEEIAMDTDDGNADETADYDNGAGGDDEIAGYADDVEDDEQMTLSGQDVRHWACGPAPIDIAVAGEYLVTEDGKNPVYVAAIFDDMRTEYVVAERSIWDTAQYTGPEDFPILEKYVKLEKAVRNSRYANVFLQLERDTDQEMSKALNAADDTAFAEGGIRIAQASNWGHPHIYAELWNCIEPERKEYLQVEKDLTSGTYRYSVTHQSMYMRMELGDKLYALYFGDKLAAQPVEEYHSEDEMHASGTNYESLFCMLMQMCEAGEH